MGQCVSCCQSSKDLNLDDEEIKPLKGASNKSGDATVSMGVKKESSAPAADGKVPATKSGMSAKKPLNKKDFILMDLEGQTVVRLPGSIDGQQFVIDGCKDCDIFLFDHSAQIMIDYCTNCRIFVGPCKSSVFFRNCEDCKFVLVTNQLRTRDSKNIDLLLYCNTRPTIEATEKLRIGCFQQFNYFEMEPQFASASLDPWHNQWSDIHDFSNTGSGVKKNYSYLPASLGPFGTEAIPMLSEAKLKAAAPDMYDELMKMSSKDAVVPHTSGLRSLASDMKAKQMLVAFGDAAATATLRHLREVASVKGSNPSYVLKNTARVLTANLTKAQKKTLEEIFATGSSVQLANAIKAESIVALLFRATDASLYAALRADIDKSKEDAFQYGIWYSSSDEAVTETSVSKFWSGVVPSQS